ncbi:MAG: dihydrolipoyl dehydrogenase [Verrucomicrobia bacterium]|nr:dihydrolipoyl dehydrogenase [Verrucomicrobiota bacterium]
MYDVAVVGSGPGGYFCAMRASQLGLKVACIEEVSLLGGTCLHYGCIPSQTLLHSSELYARFAHEAAKRGIEIEKASSHFPLMMDQKIEVVGDLSAALKALFQKHHIDVIQGRGRITDKHTITVFSDAGKKQVTAKSIVLATGSRPVPLPFLPFDEKKILSSTGALSLQTLPKSMVIIGGGAVGVELASVYSRLGTKVTIIEMMPSICTGMERSLADALYELLKGQKIRFLLNSNVIGAKDLGAKGVQLWVRLGDGIETTITGSVVVVAIGRHPLSNDLGLLELNIDVTSKGNIMVNSQFRTSHPNIYAIGDLIDGPMLAHRATLEGIAVAEIIAGQKPRLDYTQVPNVIYTNPEAATVGLTEDMAKELGKSVLTGEYELKGNPRARCARNLDGFVKVVADAETKRLLGLHILASHASEMISVGAIALAKKMTLEELASLPFPHPTYSEAIKEACLAALGGAF